MNPTHSTKLPKHFADATKTINDLEGATDISKACKARIAQARKLLNSLDELIEASGGGPIPSVIAQVTKVSQQIANKLNTPKEWKEFYPKATKTIQRCIENPLIITGIGNRPKINLPDEKMRALKPKHIKILEHFVKTKAKSLTTDDLLEVFKKDPEFSSFNQKSSLGATLASMRKKHGLFEKKTETGTWTIIEL